MTFQTQLNSMKLYRVGQTKDSLKQVRDSLNTVTVSNCSYSSASIGNDVADSKMKLYESGVVQAYLVC